MNNVNWAQPLPRVIMELQTDIPTGLRYWMARILLLLAAKIIKSKLITRRSLSVLEVE